VTLDCFERAAALAVLDRFIELCMLDFMSLQNDYVPAETRRPVAQRHQEQIVNGARGASCSGLLWAATIVLAGR
jgi:hypothetical protein